VRPLTESPLFAPRAGAHANPSSEIEALVADTQALQQEIKDKVSVKDAKGNRVDYRITPAFVRSVLDELEAYMRVVRDAAEKAGMFEDPNAGPQWRTDEANWQRRYRAYRNALAKVPAPAMETTAGAELIMDSVVQPLLFGVYQPNTPGIMGDVSQPKVPDLITPMSLGNQLAESADYLITDWKGVLTRIRRALNAMVQSIIDLIDRIPRLPKTIPWYVWVAGGAVVAGAGYIYLGRRR